MTRADVFRRTVAVALISLAATAIFIRLFGVQPVLFRLFPGVLLCCLGYALGTAGGRSVQRGNGAVVGLLLTILVVFVLGGMTIADQEGQVGPLGVFEGAVEGLGIILGSVVPAPVTAETMTFTIIIVAYGALVSSLTVTSRVPASSLLPALVVFLSGLALSQGSTTPAVPFAAAFVAAAVVGLALMPSSPAANTFEDGAEFAQVQTNPAPGKAMRAVTVAIGAAVIAFVSAVVGPATGVGDVRTPVDPHKKSNFRPDTDLDGDNVVTMATKWQTLRRDDPFEVFRVTGQLPRAANWAINDKFDGVTWSSLSTFAQVPPAGIPYVGAEERFTITGSAVFQTAAELPGPWLPAGFRPINVTGVAARADDEGTVVAGDDRAASKSYSVTYRALAMRSLKPLNGVAPVRQAEYGTLRELPSDFPLELRYFATSAMSSGTTPYARLEGLASALSGPGFEERTDVIRSPLDSESLREMVLVSKSGTQAQFATAFALMARSQGFPTRLVVGFAIKGKGASKRVKSTDVIIYPEVQLTRVGWVPFAPGPLDLQRGVPVIQKYKPSKSDKAPPDAKPTPQPRPEPEPQPEPTEQPQEQRPGAGMGRWLSLLLAVAVLAAWPLLVAWRRNRLRAGYRRGTPDEQVVGAWAYLRAWRRRLGAPLVDASSPAHYALDPDTDPTLAALARLAEVAMYAPEALDGQRADQAWDMADRLVTETLRSSGLGRKARWYLIPALRGHRSALDAQELIRT